MTEVKIVYEMCQEDRARLDAILKELRLSRPNCEQCVSYLAEAWKQATEKSIPAGHPVDAVPPATVEDVVTPEPEEKPATAAPVPEPAPAAPAPAPNAVTFDISDVRRKVMGLCKISQAVKAQVKALTNEYADSITAMKPEDYPEFMARLSELETEVVNG